MSDVVLDSIMATIGIASDVSMRVQGFKINGDMHLLDEVSAAEVVVDSGNNGGFPDVIIGRLGGTMNMEGAVALMPAGRVGRTVPNPGQDDTGRLSQ